jgi:hypothetical protein
VLRHAGTGTRAGTLPANSDIGIVPGRARTRTRAGTETRAGTGTRAGTLPANSDIGIIPGRTGTGTRSGTGTRAGTLPANSDIGIPPGRALKLKKTPLKVVMRSYQGYYTRSHQNSEIKCLWAGIVLGWVTSWEVPVLHPFCFISPFIFQYKIKVM